MSLKVCFSTLGCPEWSLKEILSTAKDLNYDGVEVRGVHNELYAPKIKEFQNIDEAKELFKKFNITLTCLTSQSYLFLDDGEMLKEAYDYIDLASALGVPYVRVLGDKDPAPKGEIDDTLVKKNLISVCEYGKKHGVKPLIETNGVYADSARLKKLLSGIENVGVVWDVHHPYRYFNEAPDTTYGNLGEYIKHVHLKDSVLTDGKLKYEMLTYGDIPVLPAIELLKKQGYDGYYCLEWVRRWDLSLEEAGIAFAHFAGVMCAL